MVGTRPVWRAFTSGMTDGPDVLQLEQTLAWIGYGKYLTVDSTFSSGTANAINAFEKDRGITQTGGLTAQQVVFLPGPVRVASQTAAIGGSASGNILTVTGTTPLIHVDLDASLVANATVGAVAAIDLPNSKTVNGTITDVGAATSTTSSGQGGQSGTTTTTVGVTLSVNGADLSQFNGAAVVVHLVTAEAKEALSVPVKSLLALAEGGYAVERVRSGAHQLVKVTPGTFAGGFVQVSGDVRAGDQVVSP
jgi:peptidoglycan hydrolase-like protein with peptidoglycan-binding domain